MRWERLTPIKPLDALTGVQVSGDWIERIFNLTASQELSYCFQLSDFLQDVHVRLDGSTHPYADPIIEEVSVLSEKIGYTHPSCAGLIHGDLHPDNLMNTTKGLRIIDWESSCCGPLEWDAAQNLRYTPRGYVPGRIEWWKSRGVDLELLFPYRRVRSMSSLSHMIAVGIKPTMYYTTLSFLGWEEK